MVSRSRPGHENYNTTAHSSCSTPSLLLAAQTKFIRKFPARNLSNANDESLLKFRAASAKRSRNFRSRKKITHETTQQQMEKILKYRAAAAQRQREYRRRKKELTDESSELRVKNKTSPENVPKPKVAAPTVIEAGIVEKAQNKFADSFSHEYSATTYLGDFITSDTESLTAKMESPTTCSICRRYDGCPYPLNEAVKPVSDMWFEGIADQEALIRRILKMNQNYCGSRCCVCQNCYSEFHRIYSFLRCCVQAHNHMLDNQANLSQVQDVVIKQEPPYDFDVVPTMEMVPTHATNVKTEPIVDCIQPRLIRAEPEAHEADTKWVIEEYLTESMPKDDANVDSENFTVAAVSVESGRYDQIQEEFPSSSEHYNRLCSPTFRCTECPAIFTCSNDLKSHQSIHNYQKYSCENCGQQFGKIEGLKVHQRVHTGETFDCDDCGMQFTRSDSLRKHKFRHNEVTFPCDECGAEYRSQCSLENHKQSHTGETFVCTECSSKFPTRQAHRNHMRIHTGTKLNCDQCGAQFLNEILLRTHRRIHTGETYNCDQCDAKFIRAYSLTLHRFMHVGKSYACSQCPAKCYTARGLNAHVRYKHKKIIAGKIFSCDQCDAKFTTKRYLKIHKRGHNSVVNNVNCDQCPTKFDSIDSLKIHERKHNVERFKCDQCEAKFSRKDSLMQHTRIHTGETFDCDQCGAKFTKAYNLRNHKRVHTGEMFSCDQCYAKFSFVSNLRTHQKVQHEKPPTDELDDETGLQQLSMQKCIETKEQIIATIQEEVEQFKCDQCEAQFTCRKNLRVHKRSRHSGMSFGCDECHATFSTMEFLKRHQPIHTGQKFTCDQCDAKFSRESYLKIHRRIHTGLTFNCDQCDAKFITAHLLQRHLWTHTGQKPYACNQCDARFLETRSLKSHMRRHTGERLKCDRCDARFIREDTLKAHKKTHIGTIAEDDVVVVEEARRGAESVAILGDSQNLLCVEEVKIEI